MKLIPGKLYIIKNNIEDHTFLQRNVFGYQYNSLQKFLFDCNGLMFINATEVDMKYHLNSMFSQKYYNFLGGIIKYTFVLEPIKEQRLLECFND